MLQRIFLHIYCDVKMPQQPETRSHYFHPIGIIYEIPRQDSFYAPV